MPLLRPRASDQGWADLNFWMNARRCHVGISLAERGEQRSDHRNVYRRHRPLQQPELLPLRGVSLTLSSPFDLLGPRASVGVLTALNILDIGVKPGPVGPLPCRLSFLLLSRHRFPSSAFRPPSIPRRGWSRRASDRHSPSPAHRAETLELAERIGQRSRADSLHVEDGAVVLVTTIATP